MDAEIRSCAMPIASSTRPPSPGPEARDPLGRTTTGVAEPARARTGSPAPIALLEIADLTLEFGGVTALDRVTLSVLEGELFALIGPNGAGKTSLLNSISGLYRPQRGRASFHPPEGAAVDLLRTSPPRIAASGIARSFQNIELFRHMTVLDNLMLGRHVHLSGGVVSCGLFWGRQRAREILHRERVEEIVDFLEIQSLRRQPVGTLAYGLQKRVELARALALEPKLLLLDEPMAGMNAEEKEDMARYILDINQDWGVTTVLIEHDMGVVMDLSDRIAVLDFGKVIAVGTPAEISSDDLVIDAYLGRAHDREGAD